MNFVIVYKASYGDLFMSYDNGWTNDKHKAVYMNLCAAVDRLSSVDEKQKRAREIKLRWMW